MGLLSIFVIGGVIFIAGIVLVKLIFGRFFEPMFSGNFPEELKSLVRKNNSRYRANTIENLLRRYKAAKGEKDFSLENFLKKESELIEQRKRFIWKRKKREK